MTPIDDLRQGLFDLLGVQEGARGALEEGASAFSARVGGVPVSVMRPDHDRENEVLLICELGSVQDSIAASEWEALLEANAGVAVTASPRFCRNPMSSEAVLLWPMDMEEVSVHELSRRVLQSVDAAQCWNTQRSAGAMLAWYADIFRPGPVDHVTAAAAHDRFQALYREVCEAAGQVAGAGASSTEPVGGDCAFSIRIDGIAVALGHGPAVRPGWVEIGVPLGGLIPQAGPAELEALMDSNFMMALQPGGGPWVCRGPSSGGLLLRLEHRPGAMKGSDFLQQLAGLVRLAQGWARGVTGAGRTLH